MPLDGAEADCAHACFLPAIAWAPADAPACFALQPDLQHNSAPGLLDCYFGTCMPLLCIACALADAPACHSFQPDLQRDSAPGPLDDWEVDPAEIQFHEKIASGAFGDLYRGTYCGQDVAIKIVRNVQNDTAQFQEFLQVCWGCMAWPSLAHISALQLYEPHCAVPRVWSRKGLQNARLSAVPRLVAGIQAALTDAAARSPGLGLLSEVFPCCPLCLL